MRQYFLCDMHSHLLPGMDDGCKNEAMALEMLRQASEQHVQAMVCTPHYYPTESIDHFLNRREAAIQKLEAVAASAPFPCPALFYGAEVAYFPGISDQEELPRLCLRGTDYLLLEMPFHPWSPDILEELHQITHRYGIRIIIAHLERYLKFAGWDALDALLSSNVLIQMNGEALLHWRTARKARKLLESGRIQFLGSDTHNTESRPQTLGRIPERMEKWGLDRQLAIICQRSREILHT